MPRIARQTLLTRFRAKLTSGRPFWDPEADAALFGALDRSVRQTSNRQLVRVKRHINEPEFASAIVNALRPLVGRPGTRRKVAR